jgi:hypothetical protein
MGTHPITAGHGYPYLTRRIAVQDGHVVGSAGRRAQR